MKILATGLAILIGLASTGAIYQHLAVTQDRSDFPPPGRIYDIDGLALHLDCRGQGSPTIVLEAGLTSGSASWATVHDALAAQTRTCAYDRPGLDWSAPIKQSQSAEQVSERLHTLLQAAEINDDQVLVGMSAGGIYVREYFHRYPEHIVGMVLVDSSHEAQLLRLPELDAADDMKSLLNTCRYLQPLGLVRAFDMLADFYSHYDIPLQMKHLILANMNQSHACDAMYWEVAGFNNEVNAHQTPRPLGALPLIVLSQGIEPEEDRLLGISRAEAAALRNVWDDLQLELTALSKQGSRRVATKSGHVIQLEQPQIVIDSILELVQSLREQTHQPRPTATTSS